MLIPCQVSVSVCGNTGEGLYFCCVMRKKMEEGVNRDMRTIGGFIIWREKRFKELQREDSVVIRV